MTDYIKNRIEYLRGEHGKALNAIDYIASPVLRQNQWRLINELHARYSELEMIPAQEIKAVDTSIHQMD